LSAGWLHGSLLHIIFNMMWVRDLGPVVADMYGAGRMVIIYTVAGVSGFLLSSFAFGYLPHLPFLSGAGFTVGASASVFGFLGALVYYGRRTGSSLTRSEAIRYALILGFFGFVMRGIDNFAHAGGFFGGYLAARVLGAAESGQIVVSQTTHDLVEGSGLEFDDRGEHELKGIEGARRLYAVR